MAVLLRVCTRAVLSVAPASGSPITFTKSITRGANTFFGEPDSVLSLSIGSDVSLAMLVDVLSPRLFQFTATGSIVDKVDPVEFDGAAEPSTPSASANAGQNLRGGRSRRSTPCVSSPAALTWSSDHDAIAAE